jgi:hypothetical protein
MGALSIFPRISPGHCHLGQLTQAYFAFRGMYAEGPTSVSSIGNQIKEVRDLLPDAGSFINAISSVSSNLGFPDLLERLGAQDGALP